MKYTTGEDVILGDIVKTVVPGGYKEARVVMLGSTYEHLNQDKTFVDWVRKEKIIDNKSIYVEWIEDNPFEHNDPQYAPVGNQMATPVDDFVIFVKRTNK